MAKRATIADLQQAVLRPQAAPVDAFEQAGRADPGEGLRQLAGSLRSIQPSLNRFIDNRQAKVTEEEILAAQRDRLKNSMDYAEAVSQGIIPEGANPHYIRAYKELDGKLAGQQEYTQFLQQKYQESGLASQDFATGADRAAAFEPFAQAAREEYLADKEDVHWISGFEQGRASAENQTLQQFQQDSVRFQSQLAEDTAGKQIADLMYSPGSVKDNAAAIADFGRANRGKFGMSYQKYNEMVLNTVETEAKTLALSGRYEDAMNALNILEHVETAPGQYLGQTGAGRETIANVAASVQNIQRQNDNYAWSLQTRQWQLQDQSWKNMTRSRSMQEFAREDTLAEAYVWIAQEPGGDIEEKIRELTAKDPKIGQYAVQLRNAHKSRVRSDRIVLEEKTQMTSLRLGITNGTVTMAELGRAHDEGQMSTDTFFQMMDDLARNSGGQGKVRGLSKDNQDAIKMYRDGLTDIAKGDVGVMGAIGAGAKAASFDVQRMFDNDLYSYLEENPTPTRAQLMEFLEGRVSSYQKSPLFKPKIGPSNLRQAPSAPNVYADQQSAPVSDNPFAQ